MGGKQWNQLTKEVSVFCSNGTSRNFRDRSKGQKCNKKGGGFYEEIPSIQRQMVNYCDAIL